MLALARRSEQKGVEAALRTLLPELLDDGWTAEDLGPAGFTVDLDLGSIREFVMIKLSAVYPGALTDPKRVARKV